MESCGVWGVTGCGSSTGRCPSWKVRGVHCTVLHCNALYCTARHRTVPYCTALHCNVLYRTALYCTRGAALACGLPFWMLRLFPLIFFQSGKPPSWNPLGVYFFGNLTPLYQCTTVPLYQSTNCGRPLVSVAVPWFVCAAKKLFNRAALYVAVHGAAMTNMVFMPSRTTVLDTDPTGKGEGQEELKPSK